jgi:Xaa-Pro aminopeptidase
MSTPDSPAPYREHRARFLARLEREGAAAIVPTGAPLVRNGDSEHRFRPHSDFWYLTGFREPDAVLVLVPAGEGPRSVLFVNERDRDAETWTGRRLGVEAAPAALGVDAAYPRSELFERLPELLPGHSSLVFGLNAHGEFGREIVDVVGDLQQNSRAPRPAPHRWVEPALWLHEQRLRKSAGELALMRRAARVSVEAHSKVMAAARPGGNERELEALLDFTFRGRGGTGAAYGNIVAGGANACILHYVYDVVLAAERSAIARVRPGGTQDEVHDAAVAALVDGLLEHGLLTGSREEALEARSYRRFYMHRTGHWLGLDVHDCGAYAVDGTARPLEPGMVTTVEPGLYVAEDDETVEPRWRGIGIRIEDDVLVTADGHEVLTAALPTDAAEVEALCRDGSPAVGARG